MSREVFDQQERPFVMAGPCSAESEEQLLELAEGLKARGAHLFRAGLWKPRTRPNTFEGVGEAGMAWLSNVQRETGLAAATEVANSKHVELALQHGIAAVWIGARTAASPFAVQEIADALRGSDVPVIVKNPINPDVSLWLGAVERLEDAGIRQLALIHRGFSFFNSGQYRNSPMWQIPIDMRAERPDLMMLCDISHISGRREMLRDVAQEAMDLAYSGLMIEVHQDPDNALSDPKQQITLAGFDDLMSSLIIREQSFDDVIIHSDISAFRDQIDSLDREIIALLAERLKVVRQIGEIKGEFDIPVLQPKRWQEILKQAKANGSRAELTTEFIEELFKAIHQESIHHQIEVMNLLKVDGAK